MLTHPTLEQMHALGLKGMAAAYHDMAEQGQAEELNRDDWLALMLDREAATRADKRLANRLRAARLRFAEACIEDIDFASERGLDRRAILSLAGGAWLKAHENLIIIDHVLYEADSLGFGRGDLGAGLRQEPHHRERGDRLAASRFADDRERLPGVYLKVDPAQDLDPAVGGAERGAKSLDL